MSIGVAIVDGLLSFPPGTRFGSPAAAEFLQARRSRVRAEQERTPIQHVFDLTTTGGVPARIYVPSGAQRHPLVIYFHGGGWATGDLDMHDPTCRTIAAQGPAVVVNVDYRLAPENPFPVPLDDCYEATQWALAQADAWGADPAATVLAGTSAGGNLAAAVAVRRRDEGAEPLAGLILLYPVLDGRMVTASYSDNAEGFVLTADEMRFYWDAYVQDGRDRSHPWLSPGLVDDLAGLPPTLVVTAENDPLRDEGDAMAARLADASLLVEHVRAAGQIHGFLTIYPKSDEAMYAMKAVLRAVRTMTRGLTDHRAETVV